MNINHYDQSMKDSGLDAATHMGVRQNYFHERYPQSPPVYRSSTDNEITDIEIKDINTKDIENLQMDVDPELNVSVMSLASSMSDLTVKNTTCVICKSTTSERVTGICVCKCVYFCHESCLTKWIIYKQNDAFCVMCSIPYNIELIERAIFNSSRHNHTHGKRDSISNITQYLPQISSQTPSQSIPIPGAFDQNMRMNIQTNFLSPYNYSPQSHPQNTPFNTPVKSHNNLIGERRMSLE